MVQINKTLPGCTIFSDHALERLRQRFAISPFEVSYLLDTAKTSVDFEISHEKGLINRVLWVGQQHPFMIIKQDVQSGVIVTVWTDEIFQDVIGRKISNKMLKQAVNRFYFRPNQNDGQSTMPCSLQRHKRPMVDVEYWCHHANKLSKRSLGRIEKGVCELAWKDEKRGNIESLLLSRPFYHWLSLQCKQKAKITLDQISSLAVYLDEQQTTRFEASDILTFCTDNNALDIFSKSTRKEGVF